MINSAFALNQKGAVGFGAISFMASLDTVGSGAIQSGVGVKGVNNPGSGAWGVGGAAEVVNGAGCVPEPAGGPAGCCAATHETGPGIFRASGPVVLVAGERSALGTGNRSSVACDRDGKIADAIAGEGAAGAGCA